MHYKFTFYIFASELLGPMTPVGETESPTNGPGGRDGVTTWNYGTREQQ